MRCPVFLIILLIGLLIVPVSFADTHVAADCESATIAAILADETFITGDVLSIPTGSCTWTSGVTVPNTKAVTIQGNGYSNTVITHGAITAITLGTSGARVTGIGFTTTNIAAISISTQGNSFRIDHCQFTNSLENNNPLGAGADASFSTESIMIQGTTSVPAGLIDNNDFVRAKITVNGSLTFSVQGTAWAAESILGTGNAVVIEDNTFYRNKTGRNVIDSGRASSVIARYNTVNGITQFMVHGLQDDGERGGRMWEYYGNNFTAGANAYNGAMRPRAGTGIISYNTFDSFFQSYQIGVDFPRGFTGGCADAGNDCDTFGMCDGIVEGGVLSIDTGTADYLCRDQVGAGRDASTWSNGAIAPDDIPQAAPVYLWSNYVGVSKSVVSVLNSTGAYIQANRDYYETQAGAFDGTIGTGCGTLAARPATCTIGVGYWATNQSCVDLTGMVGAGPSTPISGTLYKCTATDTWSSYYTPYTYPHPLRAAAASTLGSGMAIGGGVTIR